MTVNPDTAEACAIYLRISLDPSGKQEAVTRQLADCMRLLALKGWTLYGEPYCDNSISAFNSDKQRPAYNQMVEDFLAGKFNKIICWDLDRLTRQPRQLEDWIEWAVQRGLMLVTANGEADLSTDGGRMYARIKAAVARGEVERKSARQLYANEFRAGQGLPALTGPRPFGYQKGCMELHPTEAPALQWAAAQVLIGKGLKPVARELTERGFSPENNGGQKHTTTGITAQGLRYMLRNPRYAALRMHQGKIVGPGQWPAILDMDTHTALVSLLGDPGRCSGGGRRGRLPIYLLSGGVVLCGVCDAPVQAGQTRSDGVQLYRCRSPRHCASGHRVAMEAKVTRAVIELLSHVDVITALTPSDDDAQNAHRDHAQRIRNRLDFMEEDFAGGGWDHNLDGFRKMKGELLAELAEVESKIRSTPELRAFDGLAVGQAQVREQWTNLDMSRQRAIIALLLDVRLLASRSVGRWSVDQHLQITPKIEMSKLSLIQFHNSIKSEAA